MPLTPLGVPSRASIQAAIDEVQAAHDADMGTWANYTPTLSNWTLGNGTLSGEFLNRDGMVDARILFTLGSTTNPSGNLVLTLPVPGVARTGRSPLGRAIMVDISVGSNRFIRTAGWNSASSILFTDDSGTLVTGTTPFAFASGDIIDVTLRYRAA